MLRKEFFYGSLCNGFKVYYIYKHDVISILLCATTCMNPATQGKSSVALYLLTLFGQANKVRRQAVRKLPVLNFIL